MAKPAEVSVESPALDSERPPKSGMPAGVTGAATWADDRLGLASLLKKNLRKIFPDHWSFLLGEIALYSFVVLLLTGVFLTIWFKPSMAEIEYEGSYQLMRGLPMSEAFASTLALSFDIRGGLLVRQIHHWAAMLFLASMTVHMLRIFFTGAFRKPRELNWLIGVGLLGISLIEGFAGYSLPDDLLSGTGLRFVDGLIRSIPLIGTWAEFFIFAGEFPGSLVVARLYMVHILLVPAVLLGLIAAHLTLVVYHKHTQYPGAGRKDGNVVGYPLFPVYMAKAGGFFFVVFGVSILMGATMQINPVWNFGPYNPAQVTAGSQPDWYMGFVEGAIRIMPNWEWHLGSTTWSWNVFLPGMGLLTGLFVLLGAWPFVERWITGDDAEHHVLDRPRNNPTRTGLGVAGITCYAMFWLSGGNDILATQFRLSLNAVTEFMRVAVFLAPVVAFIVTKRICISLQRADHERVLHGSETGIIERSPDGGYSEPHRPIHTDEKFMLTQHAQGKVAEVTPATDGNGVLEKGAGVSKTRALASRWYHAGVIDKPTADEIAEADHHANGHADGHDGDHQVTESETSGQISR